LNYHRFWHEVDLAVAMGVLATYFPDMTYKVPGTPSTNYTATSMMTEKLTQLTL